MLALAPPSVRREATAFHHDGSARAASRSMPRIAHAVTLACTSRPCRSMTITPSSSTSSTECCKRSLSASRRVAMTLAVTSWESTITPITAAPSRIGAKRSECTLPLLVAANSNDCTSPRRAAR